MAGAECLAAGARGNRSSRFIHCCVATGLLCAAVTPLVPAQSRYPAAFPVKVDTERQPAPQKADCVTGLYKATFILENGEPGWTIGNGMFPGSIVWKDPHVLGYCRADAVFKETRLYAGRVIWKQDDLICPTTDFVPATVGDMVCSTMVPSNLNTLATRIDALESELKALQAELDLVKQSLQKNDKDGSTQH